MDPITFKRNESRYDVRNLSAYRAQPSVRLVDSQAAKTIVHPSAMSIEKGNGGGLKFFLLAKFEVQPDPYIRLTVEAMR